MNKIVDIVDIADIVGIVIILDIVDIVDIVTFSLWPNIMCCTAGIEDLAVRCGSQAQGEGVNVSLFFSLRLNITQCSSEWSVWSCDSKKKIY